MKICNLCKWGTRSNEKPIRVKQEDAGCRYTSQTKIQSSLIDLLLVNCEKHRELKITTNSISCTPLDLLWVSCCHWDCKNKNHLNTSRDRSHNKAIWADLLVHSFYWDRYHSPKHLETELTVQHIESMVSKSKTSIMFNLKKRTSDLSICKPSFVPHCGAKRGNWICTCAYMLWAW